jgi:hypothetical protein
VARQHVEHIDQPARQRAVLLRAGADAAIDRGTLGAGEHARELADGRCIDAAAPGHRVGRERGHRGANLLDAGHVRGHRAEPDQPFLEQRVHHRREQEDIGTRTDEVMRIGHRGGFGAPRIHHHQLAAAPAQGLGLAAEVRHRPQAAVAGHGVGAKHQQQVAALDVGHGHAQPAAEHQPAGQLLGHLVQRGRRIHVLRAERLRELREVQQQRHLVRRGVADHRGHRVAPVALDQGRQAALDLGEGLVPGRLDEAAVALDARRAQPIRVFVQFLQRHRLGAQVAGAERVALGAADREHLAAVVLDLEAAAGFAQRADAVGGLVHGCTPGWARTSRFADRLGYRAAAAPCPSPR